jgi:hypothetical protein
MLRFVILACLGLAACGIDGDPIAPTAQTATR